jgi:CRISPR-associated Csx11 family protein
MGELDLNNLKRHREEILKAEAGTLLFNLGKTHVGFWEKKNGDTFFRNIDKSAFKKCFGYHPFPGYRCYHQKTDLNKTPFEIDLSFSQELTNFFWNTEIVFDFINQHNSMTLKDVVKGDVSGALLIKKVMFRGCENVNSGIDKGAPKEQLKELQIANAFGTIKDEITDQDKKYEDHERYDCRRRKFFKEIDEEFSRVGWDKIGASFVRRTLLEKTKEWYSLLLSDTRFPVNDVTLWDQVYMTASMFKASLAAMCLEDGKYDEYMVKPREIKWSILGVQYDKLGLAEKALTSAFIDWYRNETERVDEKVKAVIEEKYALGNEIYRDESGIYFIVPENILGERFEEKVGVYRLKEELGPVREDLISCFKSFTGEVFPSILLTEPSRGTMNIAYLLDNAKTYFLMPEFPKDGSVMDYFQDADDVTGFRVICDICRVRLAKKDEEDLNLCSICRQRKEGREKDRLRNAGKETIWTGELQDENRRIALVTMKFELADWLNGNMLNTMLTVTTESAVGKSRAEALKEIGSLLKNIKKTFCNFSDDSKKVTWETFAGFDEWRKERLRKSVGDFLLYYEEGVHDLYDSTIARAFHDRNYNKKNPKELNVFRSYFYSFLEKYFVNLSSVKVNKETETDFYKFIDECHRLDLIPRAAWGNSPHNTALGIFSLAYLIEQINGILLERSIGDAWEQLLVKKLGTKIDFQNRKIYWNRLLDDEIEFLSAIILQFLLRKNPSPARFRRIWETTERFLTTMEEGLLSEIGVPRWRQRRIKWSHVIKEERFFNKAFTYRGLDFISDEEGSLVLISSLEKAIPLLCRESLKGKTAYIDGIRKLIENGEEGESWIKEKIELVLADTDERCRVELTGAGYIAYKPYLSIIKPTPVSWQFIIPAVYVPELLEKTQKRYDQEFKYVKGKLPLHVGVIFQDYKKPLYVGIKALRKIRRDLRRWQSIQQPVSGESLKMMIDGEESRNKAGDDSVRLKEYYSLYPLSDGGKVDYRFYLDPGMPPVEIKSVARAKRDETYIIYPNTFDFEFLDVNTRRNEIRYKEECGSRKVPGKGNHPYDLASWHVFEGFRDNFTDNVTGNKLQNMVSLIYTKLSAWEDTESIKVFILSALINTFELKDRKARDEFCRSLGHKAWEDLEQMESGLFKKELLKFLDLYDFWHNCLGKV